MIIKNWPSWYLLVLTTLKSVIGADDDYNVVHKDGSFEFGYETPDSYHHALANRKNVVRGEFGGRNPGTGAIDSVLYTAGPRGFRPRGKNVVRKYDLSQSGPRPVGSPDDPYYDPFEDPSYSFGFRTRTYDRQENANRVGDVTGKYSYLDDIGERHNVEFIAGKNTGFHVKTPYPDSNPRAFGPLYFRGRGRPIPRGRTSIQRGLDGSYRFVSAGPDQRRTETSDSTGHVRGSYTYLDDKGVQHSVHYIAGPETGYRVLKNVKGPHLPTIFPFGRPDIIPADFYDPGDLFDTAASGHVRPKDKPGNSEPSKADIPSFDTGIDVDKEDFDKFNNDLEKPGVDNRPTSVKPGQKPSSRPSYDDEDGNDNVGDIFGGPSGPASPSTPLNPSSPGKPSAQKPPTSGGVDSFKPGEDDGQYRPPEESDSYSEKPFRGENGAGGDRGDSGYEYDGGNGDFGLFDGKPQQRPSTGRPAPGTDGVRQPGKEKESKGGCQECRGTIVTNVGDKLFSVPPGASVRAHVQSIDLVPVIGKAPSPSEQYNVETRIKTEQLNSATNNLINSTETTMIIPASTIDKANKSSNDTKV